MQGSKFDELLTRLGTGKWNILYFFTAGFWYTWLPGQFFSGIYLAPEMEHTCLPPDNITNISEDQCSYYVTNTTASGAELLEGNNATSSAEELLVAVPCTAWSYNSSIYTNTLTSRFDLVCGRAYLRATYQSALVFPTMFSSIIAGYLADRYGRRTIVVITQGMCSMLSIAMSLATNFSAVLAIRMITGTFFLPTSYVLALEVCEVKHRSVVGIVTGFPWALGTVLWGAFAYGIRDWRYLNLAFSLPTLLLFPCLYLMDESPRWLIVKGKHEKALKVVKKAARWNKSELPPDSVLLASFSDIQREQNDAEVRKEAAKRRSANARSWFTIPRLLSTTKIRIITVLLCLVLFVCSLAYVGVSLSGDVYSSDPFLYMVILGITQMPSYSVSAPIINWLGRKKPLYVTFFVTGICIASLGFIPKDIPWLLMTLAMIGMLCISCGYMIVFVYISELLPTEVRLQGVGTTSTAAQVAAVLAPYITIYLGPKVAWLPSVLFGGSCFFAALAIIPLKETLGAPMLETVEELDNKPRIQAISDVPEEADEQLLKKPDV